MEDFSAIREDTNTFCAKFETDCNNQPVEQMWQSVHQHLITMMENHVSTKNSSTKHHQQQVMIWFAVSGAKRPHEKSGRPQAQKQQQPEETISSEVSGMETGQNNEQDQGLGKIQDHKERNKVSLPNVCERHHC